MAEGTEVEERVDLDEENYMEEMDDDAEEQIDEDVEEQLDDDDDGIDGSGYENVEENVEVHEDSVTEPTGKDQSPEADRSHIASESIEDEEKPAASVDNDEKEKHAELLALPPHGSEVFIGGLPRDAQEEDLRNLCEPIGEILEVETALTFACEIFFFSSFHWYCKFLLYYFCSGTTDER